MRLKELESSLQDVAVFDSPKLKLEQYCTTPHLAARMLFTAHSNYDDIEGKTVADFGCGCALDIDSSALCIAQNNCSNYKVNVDFILTDLMLDPLCRWKNNVDTVVMNPPFGTKNNKGIDMIFLKKALEVAATSVYSLHKSSTREYILRKAQEWNVECEVLAEMKFDVPMMYKFHKKKSVDINVDFLRFEKKK
ncbi:17974_t:CDS:2 [Cetraspora pellucida]|uniref:17974_t:CDS:1 n=1 Tax=Cetraspora pellucida TaxID=1433469 RepID=A0ACA9MH58_9GLOM|nr:17974_t:CDS:2 [Cetraspora pellucida]